MVARIDVQSETWKAVTKWARDREEQALTTLASPSCDERWTMLKRGEIAVLRQLALLPQTLDQIAQQSAQQISRESSHG